MSDGLQALSERIRRVLAAAFDAIEIDGDGDVTIRQESARVFVSLGLSGIVSHGDSAPGSDSEIISVDISAPLVTNAMPSPAVWEYVALHADDYIFGHLSAGVRDGVASIWLSRRMLAPMFADDELVAAVAGLLATANEIDDRLATEFAGDVFHGDDEGRDEVETDSTMGPAANSTPDEARQEAPLPFELVTPRTDVLGRDAVLDEIIPLLATRDAVAPLIIGPSGSGRTSLMSALAARIQAEDYRGPLAGDLVVRVNPEAVVAAQRALTLRRILEEVGGDVVLVLDDIEVMAALGSGLGDRDLLGVIRAAANRKDVRIVLTIDAAFSARLEATDREFAAELHPVRLEPIPADVLKAASQRTAEALAQHHGVTVPEDVLALAAAPRDESDELDHPGLAIRRLDLACARAALRADRVVTDQDFHRPTWASRAPLGADVLGDALRRRVIGQDEAVTRVAERLALTRAGIDLRPEKPDGVFLFVGPTGVGKTELARSIATEIFGDDQRLIRLDMSEYAEAWALSRLTGPQPGYSGYDQPEGWLTTRVRHAPYSVLLLDEIEKAHPSIWNAFLQVFDAGRLTDSRGVVVDFSKTVIAMTSNLGANVFGGPALGFAPAGGGAPDQERVLDVVTATMPAEFINRIDEVIVFLPLTREKVRDIAEKEIARSLSRLATRGFELQVDDGVIDFLADTGYDPQYGARHLQRNIERLLLQPLAGSDLTPRIARLADGTIVWQEP